MPPQPLPPPQRHRHRGPGRDTPLSTPSPTARCACPDTTLHRRLRTIPFSNNSARWFDTSFHRHQRKNRYGRHQGGQHQPGIIARHEPLTSSTMTLAGARVSHVNQPLRHPADPPSSNFAGLRHTISPTPLLYHVPLNNLGETFFSHGTPRGRPQGTATGLLQRRQSIRRQNPQAVEERAGQAEEIKSRF